MVPKMFEPLKLVCILIVNEHAMRSVLVAACLTLILLITTTPTFANSVDPDQMASEEAIWSGSTLFVVQFVNLNKNIIWCNLIAL